MEELIGRKLGQYEIREKVGEGGMAHVFKAYQPSLSRFVAIKILAPVVAEKQGFTERFQREARSIARLNHPNILPVYDFGVQDGYNYVAMRYVENSTTLGQLMEENTPLDKLIDYLIQVADALNYAHGQGIIHRDVKPSNILIDGRWALLSDFGLVKMSEETTTHLTSTGLTLGTPAYMSPEQVEGSKVDHRTDIYALGVILYKVLTGTIPHESPTPIGILVKRRTEPAPAPHKIKPDVSRSLEKVALRSLAMKPDDRYSSAINFAEALKKAQTTSNHRGYKEKPVERVETVIEETTLPHVETTLPRQYRNLLIGGGVAALLGIGGLIFLLFSLLGGGNDNPVVQNDSASPTAIVETDTPPPLTTTAMVPTVPPQIVAQTKLEIRSGPGEIYELLGYLPTEATAEVTGRDETNQWWRIKTALAATGIGWIKADPASSKATNVANLPIALAPPTPTPTAEIASTPPPTVPTTPPPTLEPPTVTFTPETITPTSVVTPTRPRVTFTPNSDVSAPSGQFTLLKPTDDDMSSGPFEFEWRWDGSLGPDQGFEVRVWREGEPPAGIHNAVEDNQKGAVAAVGNNTYRLSSNIRDATGVRGRGGEYLWTVVLIQISPEYKDLGVQAPPGHLKLALGGGGSNSGGGGSNNGGGGFQ